MTQPTRTPATGPSKPQRSASHRRASQWALTLLLLAAGQASVAQTNLDIAAVCRASSRLGYGPTPASAQAASADPKAWAMRQIDEAYAASRQPPRIPAGVAAFNAPISDIVAGYQPQRLMVQDARRQAVEQNTAMAAGSSEVQPNVAGLQEFSREMAQTAAAWRLMSCSDPAMEQPLLARMTEFWFDHFSVSSQKASVRPFVGHYVVNAIRANAFAEFEDLVLATARHPAMLFYLDQAQSNARGLNGNTLFKTPMDFACSALTAGGSTKEKRDVQLTLGFLAQAGQPMHDWQTPDDYKTSAATWLAPEALTRRADYALNLGAPNGARRAGCGAAAWRLRRAVCICALHRCRLLRHQAEHCDP